MSAEALQINLDEHVRVWPPVTYRFSTLNDILKDTPCRLLRAPFADVHEALAATSGVILFHCRWVHEDNRDAPLAAWDWDSNYEHCKLSAEP